ncbi:MAG TPA: hypothetical protein VF677_12290 [Flavobacterium sp.]|jgi:hypothetical protein
MKKIILLFTIAGAIFLNSCSNSDSELDSDDITSDVLLKRTIETYQVNGTTRTSTTNFVYNGNKLVSSIETDGDDRTETRYTYTGDLITKEEFFENNELDETLTYEYNSDNKLIICKRTIAGFNLIIKEVYIHNSDGTISVSTYTGDTISQDQLESNGRIYFTNDEISRTDNTEVGSIRTRMITYTYDAKNNPLKNITGFSKIAFVDEDNTGQGKHNILTEVSLDQGFPETTTISFQYTYNTDDYPQMVTESLLRDDGTTEESIIQYFY